MISPTGKGVRNDSMGSGSYLAEREGRHHHGMDFMCDPGQNIVSPITGSIVRPAKPYADDDRYSGCVISNSTITIKLFYIDVRKDLIGKPVMRGNVIGKAQDISKKYGIQMTPHVHLEIDHCDPMLFLRLRQMLP